MPGTPPVTPRLEIPRYEGSDPANFSDQVNAVVDQVDDHAAMYLSGTRAARPAASKAGRFYVATDQVAVYFDTGAAWIRLGDNAGDLKATGAGSADPGWLLADGAAVSRTGVNADLFAALGTTFGEGNGTSTFNVPDLLGRVPVGSGSGSGLTSRSRGEEFGAETHAHSHISPIGMVAGDVVLIGMGASGFLNAVGSYAYQGAPNPSQAHRIVGGTNFDGGGTERHQVNSSSSSSFPPSTVVGFQVKL